MVLKEVLMEATMEAEGEVDVTYLWSHAPINYYLVDGNGSILRYHQSMPNPTGTVCKDSPHNVNWGDVKRFTNYWFAYAYSQKLKEEQGVESKHT